MSRLEETPSALPGTIMLSEITGLAGALVSFGQWLCGDASRYTHAAITDGSGGVIEAAPGGVRRAPLTGYLDGRPIAFGWVIPLTMDQRDRIVAEAEHLLGRHYSWLTYGWLALTRLGIRPGWIRDRIARDDQLICSALCDLAYARAGIALFQDGRLPGDVTPGDIGNLLIERDWAASTLRPPASP